MRLWNGCVRDVCFGWRKPKRRSIYGREGRWKSACKMNAGSEAKGRETIDAEGL